MKQRHNYGIGKTALAVHWSHRVRDRFPDGQLYVNLAGYSHLPTVGPVEALTRFLRAMGVPPEKVPLTLDEATSMYRSMLADRRMLVLLDNAVDPEQVRPLLPTGPGSLALITSRDRMASLVALDGARRLTLDGLSPAESLDLLSRVIGRARVAAEPEAAAELAGLCGHLPLAIRITAALLADQPGTTIARHVAELREGDRLGTLALGEDPTASVRAAFDQSYERLPAQAARLFWLLGALPCAGFGAEVAAVLLGVQQDTAEGLLDQLARTHLIEPAGQGRYTFHDLLRLYAAELSSGQSDVEDSLATVYAWYAHTLSDTMLTIFPLTERRVLPELRPGLPQVAFDEVPGALAWLRQESANLIAIARHTAEHGPYPASWLLMDLLRGYLMHHDPVEGWRDTAEACLRAAQRAGSHQGQIAMELNLSNLWYARGESTATIEHCARAIELSREIGDQMLLGTALNIQGSAYLHSGLLDEAADAWAAAVTAYNAAGRPGSAALASLNLAIVGIERGRLAEVAASLRTALDQGSYPDQQPERAARLMLGIALRELGRFEESAEELAHVTRLYAAHGDSYGEGQARSAAAHTLLMLGDHAAAREQAVLALDIIQKPGAQFGEAYAQVILGMILEAMGDEAGAGHQAAALRLARETAQQKAIVQALIGLSAVRIREGAHDQAVTEAAEAVEVAVGLDYRILEAPARVALARALLAAGDRPGAAEQAQRALALAQEIGQLPVVERAQALLPATE